MLITLNNGKTVEIPFQQFDSMDDQQWKNYMDSEYGEEVNDPFYHSQIDSEERRGFTSDDDDIINDFE